MGDFRKLEVWVIAHDLTVQLYKLTARFPEEERFGLSSQIRRAAVSIESNIAEGEARYTNNDKNNFFIIARGSVAEVQTQLLIAADVFHLNTGELYKKYDILGRKLTMIVKHRRKPAKPIDQSTY